MKTDTVCHRCGLKNIINGTLGIRSSPVRFDPAKLPMKITWYKFFSYKCIIVNNSSWCCPSCGLIRTKLNPSELKKFVLDKGADEISENLKSGDLKYFEENSENCLKCASIKTIKGKITISQQNGEMQPTDFCTGNYRKLITGSRPSLNEDAIGCMECGYVFTNVSSIGLVKFILKYCKTDFIVGCFANEVDKTGLITALSDRESLVRKVAAETLGLIGNKRSIPHLILLLNDRNKKVRRSAKASLDKISSSWNHGSDAKNTIPKFIKTLKDGKTKEKAASAEALSLFEGRDVSEVLIKNATEGKSRQIREAAVKSLRKILPCKEKIYNSHPCLYCIKCFRRSKKIVCGLGLFGKEVFVYCPKCFDIKHMATGINTVAGEVGSTRKEIEKNGDNAIISLWDETRQTAIPADVDFIIVRNNGLRNIHRAINAVIIELKSVKGKPEDWLRKTPIELEKGLNLSRLEINMISDNFDVNWDKTEYKHLRLSSRI